MSLDLPVAQVLFKHMQESLRHIQGKRVLLTKVLYQALADFLCMAKDLEWFPTLLYNLVPLHPTFYGYHNASGYMFSAEVLPGLTTLPRTLQPQP